MFRPKAISLITVDLIECFFDSDAAAFQFYMYERETVDENGDVISVFVCAGVIFILIDDL